MSFENRKEHSVLETWQVMKLRERPCFSYLACLERGLRGCKTGRVFSSNPFWFVGTCVLSEMIQVGTQVPKSASIMSASPGETAVEKDGSSYPQQAQRAKII